MSELSICLLISGDLGFKILNQIHQSDHFISAVFTNSASKPILAFCEVNQLPVFVGNPRNGRAKEFISSIQSDILLSVNYLYLIEEDLIHHPQKYAINIHGSLLPKYRGRTPHVWAIINGEKQTGITAHLIDKAVDNGDIIKQVTVKIDDNDTGGDILNKFYELYPLLVHQILEEITENKLSPKPQDTSLATFFGRRTPEDGHINWDWSKERIRNWIRAQAKPYPGAFTYYGKTKLIVHRSEFSDLGFHYSDKNGEIKKVSGESIYVKTCNGCLILSDFESITPIQFKKGISLK